MNQYDNAAEHILEKILTDIHEIDSILDRVHDLEKVNTSLNKLMQEL